MKFMFDCDDTLYNLAYPFEHACKDVLSYTDVSEEMYSYYRNCGEEIFDQVQKGIVSIDESGVYRILKTCKKYNIPCSEETAQLFQSTYKHYQSHIFMSNYFHDFFSTTKNEIAILTNGQDEHQRKKLEVLGVFKYFQTSHVFTSGELGVAKPDKRAFQLVLERLNEKACDWYYIGDNYINDMQGAKQAGMKTIHLNRHHQVEGPCSDYVVYTDKELIDLIKDL